MAAVSIDSDTLGILLEYAYRGEAAQGGACRHNREAGCPICDTFTEAETALGADLPDREWWTPKRRMTGRV